MTRKNKRVLVMVGVVAIIFLGGLAYFAFSALSPSTEDRQSMIDCTLKWGRLSPFPPSTSELVITTEGTMFTRAFRTRFRASAQEVERWLSDSPGTREVLPEKGTQTTRTYLIKPGGGAQHAEVTIDQETYIVTICVYWS